MSAKRTFRRIEIEESLKKLLNAPEIPESERELSRDEALKIMTEGFRSLLSQGYSLKGVLEYLKETDCPIKDIKHGEIASLIRSEEKTGVTKRKSRQAIEKTQTGNMPELKEKTQRGEKKQTAKEEDALNIENSSFSLTEELPLDEL